MLVLAGKLDPFQGWLSHSALKPMARISYPRFLGLRGITHDSLPPVPCAFYKAFERVLQGLYKGSIRAQKRIERRETAISNFSSARPDPCTEHATAGLGSGPKVRELDLGFRVSGVGLRVTSFPVFRGYIWHMQCRQSPIASSQCDTLD